jgi:hypothetical protein
MSGEGRTPEWPGQTENNNDGTVILYNESLRGGTRLTRDLCALLKRPYILINARGTPHYSAMRLIAVRTAQPDEERRDS